MSDGRNTFPSDCMTDCKTKSDPIGYVSTVKKTKTMDGNVFSAIGIGTSTVSQSDADQKAQSAANAALGISAGTTTYSSTKSVTVSCPDGYTGPDSTAEATYVSEISQEDADAIALAQATENANAALICQQNSCPSGPYTLTCLANDSEITIPMASGDNGMDSNCYYIGSIGESPEQITAQIFGASDQQSWTIRIGSATWSGAAESMATRETPIGSYPDTSVGSTNLTEILVT